MQVQTRTLVLYYFYDSQVFFPINKLRNLALENARTEFIFQVDVDFVLSNDLEADVISAIQSGFFLNTEKV